MDHEMKKLIFQVMIKMSSAMESVDMAKMMRAYKLGTLVFVSFVWLFASFLLYLVWKNTFDQKWKFYTLSVLIIIPMVFLAILWFMS
jgi:hypothetical protein